MKSNQTPSSVWRHPVHFLAFGFGSGAMPFAPGTFGTLAAVPIYLLVMGLPGWGYFLLVLALFAIGVWLCEKTSKDLGVHDHSGIVWDEIVGYLITMMGAPAGWIWLLIGFVLFRLFDILKPWPISWMDKHVNGGFGIMLDDVAAGFVAMLGLQFFAYFVR